MARTTRIPQQRQTDSLVTTPDIKTSQLTPRLAEDGSHVREYPAVFHDTEVRTWPATRSDGRRYGTVIQPETLAMSAESATVWLACFYGFDTAQSMISRALATGTVVNGSDFETVDSQYRIRGKVSVASDKSRPGAIVLFVNLLRQHSRKSRS